MQPERHVMLIALHSRCCILATQTTRPCLHRLGRSQRHETMLRNCGGLRTKLWGTDQGQPRSPLRAREALAPQQPCSGV
jgi:hypothetical protein